MNVSWDDLLEDANGDNEEAFDLAEGYFEKFLTQGNARIIVEGDTITVDSRVPLKKAQYVTLEDKAEKESKKVEIGL